MSQFVYHAVPKGFRGDTIYPLSQLKDVYPDIYADRIKSYDWRPQVMEQKVYPLDCQWNDCVFLVATPPAEIKQALQQLRPATRFPSQFWKIDATLLDPAHTTIYTFDSMAKPIPPEDFAPYNATNIKQFARVPQRTIDYWRECAQEGGERMLLYMYIPHIMYRGAIDTSDLEVVEV